MPAYSICLIAKNEEAKIERCLRSLLPTKAEIIVADTGSDDRTKEIAAAYTKHVYDFPWINDFAAARNFSIEKASCDWILIMDCDEWITDFDNSALAYFMTHGSDRVGRVLHHNINGEEGAKSMYTVRLERFFHRGKYRYEGTIHEQIVPVAGGAAHYGDAAFTVMHDGYFGTVEERRSKKMRNITMLLAELKKDPCSAYINFQLGQSHLALQEFEKALFYYETALKQPLNYRSEAALMLVCGWINCLNELHRSEEALVILEHYDELKEYSDFLLMLGHVYTNTGQYLKAMTSYMGALACPKHHRAGSNSFLAFYRLGNLYMAMNDTSMARMCYEKCGDYAPAVEKLQTLP